MVVDCFQGSLVYMDLPQLGHLLSQRHQHLHQLVVIHLVVVLHVGVARPLLALLALLLLVVLRGHALLQQRLGAAAPLLVRERQHAVLARVRVLRSGCLLFVAHLHLALGEDGEEHGEHDENGDEEVAEEEDRVEVATRVVHDLVNVEISEERAEERDESGDLVLVALHKGAQLDEEHHREGQHRDDKRDAEEKQVDRALAQHAGGEAHLGHELREELEHFEELDAEAEGEVHLHLAEGRHHLPVVEIADCGA
mmetsp:Transcript_43040/g.107365  ORF Transcript_43040/g.107365 Transcript_43040/m.107365 type:complete len:253 (-) Transcript_43040:1463-2221(-)